MAINDRESTKELVQRGIAYHQAANCNFDLGRFRWAAAAMCKYTIRARRKAEPYFLGTDNAYARWEIVAGEQDPDQCANLLDWAVKKAMDVSEMILEMGGSGGGRPDDPLWEFESRVASFLDVGKTKAAIELAEKGNLASIGWHFLARWADLPAIRDVLDYLPTPASAKPSGYEDFPTIQSIADRADRTERTIRNWRDQGKLQIEELPNRMYRIDLRELEQVNSGRRRSKKK